MVVVGLWHCIIIIFFFLRARARATTSAAYLPRAFSSGRLSRPAPLPSGTVTGYAALICRVRPSVRLSLSFSLSFTPSRLRNSRTVAYDIMQFKNNVYVQKRTIWPKIIHENWPWFYSFTVKVRFRKKIRISVDTIITPTRIIISISAPQPSTPSDF